MDEDVVVLEVVVHEDKDVVVLGKQAGAYGYAPQKPYRPPIPSRITRQTRYGGNYSRKQCARKACVGNGREQQHRGRRERSPKQEYLGVRMCFCARGGSSLI
jgi:hypothetical protein